MTAPSPFRDFRNTLFFIWKSLGLPSPTPVQYDIAEYMSDPKEERLIVEAFRGIGKSWIAAAYCVQLWVRNPNTRILVVSGSKPRADKFATFVRRLIHEIPAFQYLQPQKHQRNSNVAFDVGPSGNDQAPSMSSIGITGQITGSRADVIIADDVETATNSLTQSSRDFLREAVKEFESILKPGGRILYLGTPQYEASLYNELRDERGYVCRVWPARYPAAEKVAAYKNGLAPMILNRLKDNARLAGQPTDTRFSNADLRNRESSIGRSTFQLQFMLDTELAEADRYPLKIGDLILHPLGIEKGPMDLTWSGSKAHVAEDIPSVGFAGDVWHRPMLPEKCDLLPYTGSVMAVDPSGRGADETAYAVVKILHGRLFLTDAGGIPGGYADETLRKLALVAQYQKVNKILVEANFGDGMFSQLLRPILAKLHACSIEEIHHNSQKEKRIIDTLEPLMNQHRLIVSEDVAVGDYKQGQDKPANQLFRQLTRITRERGCLGKDDRIDALSVACGHWVEAMAQGTDDALADSLEERLREEFETFQDGVFGVSVGAREADDGGWIHTSGW